jgi:hypothetical protein
VERVSKNLINFHIKSTTSKSLSSSVRSKRKNSKAGPQKKIIQKATRNAIENAKLFILFPLFSSRNPLLNHNLVHYQQQVSRHSKRLEFRGTLQEWVLPQVCGTDHNLAWADPNFQE